MSRRALINLGLAGLVLALVALATFRPGSGRAPDNPPLTSLDPGSLDRIRITRGDTHEMLLERTAEGWSMRRPYQRPADPARVRQLAAMLRAPSYRRFAPEPSKLAGYGLAPPLARLETDGLVLEIGGTEPLGRHRYVRRQAEVHLIDDVYVHLLLGQFEFFLDRQILDAGTPPLAAIELPDFRVYREPGGTWAIDPAEPPAHPDRLTAWAAAWRDARALEVLAPPPGQGPRLTLRFAGISAPRVFELLAQERPLLVDRGRGLAYRLPPHSPLLARPGLAEPGP